ncbi:substrate-binding periplasmic protein [Cognaticolwellia mytili]|uniref:substrate-binding periplasmic protein n=1 Tax=Cognaticolwellia mytili TaxID=1888913 RepID=UPI000A16F050|nr:transporter substrate-binding domain-containing protein [Cognaticolwellia mytili]
MRNITLLLLSLFWASFTQAQSKVIIACIDDHPPYQYLGNNPHGTHISALEVLASLLDKKLIFVQSPNFARCIAMLKKGDVDVIAGLSKTTQRSKFAIYAPFKPADELKVISKEGIVINTYDDFKEKIIGVSRGAAYFPRFDHDNTLDKVSVQSDPIGFSLLLKGRIDLIMLSPELLKTFSEEINSKKLKVSPIVLEEVRNNATFFGFSKYHKLGLSNKNLVEKITSAYQKGLFN